LLNHYFRVVDPRLGLMAAKRGLNLADMPHTTQLHQNMEQMVDRGREVLQTPLS
jgi:hypothetical protein